MKGMRTLIRRDCNARTEKKVRKSRGENDMEKREGEKKEESDQKIRGKQRKQNFY